MSTRDDEYDYLFKGERLPFEFDWQEFAYVGIIRVLTFDIFNCHDCRARGQMQTNSNQSGGSSNNYPKKPLLGLMTLGSSLFVSNVMQFPPT